MDTPRLRALSLPGVLALFLVQLHDVFLRLAAVSIGTFVPWPSITTFLPHVGGAGSPYNHGRQTLP